MYFGDEPGASSFYFREHFFVSAERGTAGYFLFYTTDHHHYHHRRHHHHRHQQQLLQCVWYGY